MYGDTGLIRALSGNAAGLNAAAVVESVLEDVALFRGGLEPQDDVTLLMVRRR